MSFIAMTEMIAKMFSKKTKVVVTKGEFSNVHGRYEYHDGRQHTVTSGSNNVVGNTFHNVHNDNRQDIYHQPNTHSIHDSRSACGRVAITSSIAMTRTESAGPTVFPSTFLGAPQSQAPELTRNVPPTSSLSASLHMIAQVPVNAPSPPMSDPQPQASELSQNIPPPLALGASLPMIAHDPSQHVHAPSSLLSPPQSHASELDRNIPFPLESRASLPMIAQFPSPHVPAPSSILSAPQARASGLDRNIPLPLSLISFLPTIAQVPGQYVQTQRGDIRRMTAEERESIKQWMSQHLNDDVSKDQEGSETIEDDTSEAEMPATTRAQSHSPDSKRLTIDQSVSPSALSVVVHGSSPNTVKAGESPNHVIIHGDYTKVDTNVFRRNLNSHKVGDNIVIKSFKQREYTLEISAT